MQIDIDLERRRFSLSIKQAAEGGEVAAEYREFYGEHAYDEQGNYIGPDYHGEGEPPAGEAPAGEAPAGEAPAENAPAEAVAAAEDDVPATEAPAADAIEATPDAPTA